MYVCIYLKRESIQQEIYIIYKSFRLCLYQLLKMLHINVLYILYYYMCIIYALYICRYYILVMLNFAIKFAKFKSLKNSKIFEACKSSL